MDLQFMNWKPDADVFGEAAGLAFGSRVLDLVVTHGDKTFPWEVVDGCDSIASGTAASADEARRAAETAGRRAFIRAA
ncbi:hypothetical protein ELH92_25900 [Rhizobium ruizarguesonis]|uniref:hypothetical protein n=1 Tax=Rhizobium ruizarguesonis TaxID=2081791 RepID=UPI0010312A5C|nr:hypothetical protein [Rhizobium ruizarguesonis]TAY24460.1 hypothetical protein ELH92_25900 [Rhizobium ruizarguesonis]